MKNINQLRKVMEEASVKVKNTTWEEGFYPYWRIPLNTSATIRFVADKDETNQMGFFIEKHVHSFNINGERKTIACIGDGCPLCAQSRAFYKQKNEDRGRELWRKRQYLFQGIVINDPIDYEIDEEEYGGKLVYLNFGFQIFNSIKSEILDGEMESIPFDVNDGINFNIKKTQLGDFPNYSNSKFARKSTALTNEQKVLVRKEAIELKTLLPELPSVALMDTMLEAYMSGYELERKAEARVVDDSVSEDEADELLNKIKERKQ